MKIILKAKNIFIVLLVVLTLVLSACSSPSGSEPEVIPEPDNADPVVTGTYNETRDNANYRLVIRIPAGRAVHEAGDNFEFTVTRGSVNRISSGRIVSFINNTFTLRPSYEGSPTFRVTISGQRITNIPNADRITFDDGSSEQGPGSFTTSGGGSDVGVGGDGSSGGGGGNGGSGNGGSGNGGGNQGQSGNFTSASAAKTWLMAQSGGTNVNSPLSVVMVMDLGDMSAADSGWRELLTAIAEAGKFIELDLSASTLDGTAFNPDPGVSQDKSRIVSISLPDTAESIANGSMLGGSLVPTFHHFSSLRNVSGEGITSIGQRAFYGLTSLLSVDFPEASSIGSGAFNGCTRLKSVSFPLLSIIGQATFQGASSLESVNFPKVTEIGRDAFQGATSLVSVSFPEAISIGQAAFQSCTSLETVNFPKVITIGVAAFSGNQKFVSVDFPQATSIGQGAFHECQNLTDVSFPQVTEINNNAFYHCIRLENVYIPKAASIGVEAFLGTGAIEIITIGATCNIDSSGAFSVRFNDFRLYYTAQNSAAGTYTWNVATETWTGPN